MSPMHSSTVTRYYSAVCGRVIVKRLCRRDDAVPTQPQTKITLKLRSGRVAIPAESHKTRLLEEKLEILLLLIGADRCLNNTWAKIYSFTMGNSCRLEMYSNETGHVRGVITLGQLRDI